MAESPGQPEMKPGFREDDPTAGSGSPPPMPRWVKWPGIVFAIVVLLLIGLRVAGVEHGPQPHGFGSPVSDQDGSHHQETCGGEHG